MKRTRSFKFLEDGLNQELVNRLKKAEIDHSVDEDGVIRYSAGDVEVVENEFLYSIRCKVFPSWQILSFPGNWIGRYMDYISRHDVPFREELIDGKLCLLIPRKYRPHAWKLDDRIKLKRLAQSKG
jgi:hypothetical protein